MKTLLAVCLPYVAGSLLFVLPYVLVSCMGSDAPPDAHMDLDDKVLRGPKEEPTPEPSEQFGYLAHYQELPLTFPNTRPCVSVLLAQGVGEPSHTFVGCPMSIHLPIPMQGDYVRVWAEDGMSHIAKAEEPK